MRIQLPEKAGGKWHRVLIIAAALVVAAGLALLVFFVWWSMNPGYFKCGHAYCG